jgi:hypothetical protein
MLESWRVRLSVEQFSIAQTIVYAKPKPFSFSLSKSLHEPFAVKVSSNLPIDIPS